MRNINDKKICFVICTNNEIYLEECLFYIEQLTVPEGYETDVISVSEAVSMTAAYNEAREATDAKYKVYLHQDVFILYKDFLPSLIEIFNNDKDIGMIGMVGVPKVPANGVMWYTKRVGGLYGSGNTPEQWQGYTYSLEDGYHRVEAIDGLLMATAYDIPWRSDIFDGWDYYDVSQSIEFQKEGYKVVVPEQKIPWCYHDNKIMNLKNYNDYRKIGLREYKDFFDREGFTIRKSVEEIKAVIITYNQYDRVVDTLKSLSEISDIHKNSILIVDNGSEDEIRYWIKEQSDYPFIVCEEILEGAGLLLKKIISEFDLSSNILFLNPGICLRSDSIDYLRKVLKDNEGCVAVSSLINDEDLEDDNYKLRRVMQFTFNAFMVRSDFLKHLDLNIIENIKKVDNLEKYLSFYAVKKEFKLLEIQKSLFSYKYSGRPGDITVSRYKSIYQNEQDQEILKRELGLNYYNTRPNYPLIEMMDKDPSQSLNILEIGCDCGANLVEIKNRFPNAHLYGVEINDNSVEIAKHVANVKLGNIEEKNIGFGEIQFDYILFGDVLEHLRDPEAAIVYCKERLKEDGKLLACIPNLMHHSVMRQLLDGNFTYTNEGLLDRTHIHLFTYNEILRLFMNAGYSIDRLSYTGGSLGAPTEVKEFVNNLLKLSNKAEEFMYYVFQYIIVASQ